MVRIREDNFNHNAEDFTLFEFIEVYQVFVNDKNMKCYWWMKNRIEKGRLMRSNCLRKKWPKEFMELDSFLVQIDQEIQRFNPKKFSNQELYFKKLIIIGKLLERKKALKNRRRINSSYQKVTLLR